MFRSRITGAVVREAFAGMAVLVCIAGCGSGAGAGDDDAVLRYFPRDSGAVALISTDLDDARYDELNGALGKRMLEKPLKDVVRETLSEGPVSFADDVEPLLGNDLAFGTPSPLGLLPFGGPRTVVAALEVRDTDKFRDILGKLKARPLAKIDGTEAWELDDEATLALDGDVAVLAEDRDAMRGALAQASEPEHLTAREFDAAAGDLREDTILRLYGALPAAFAVARLRPLARIPYVAALRTSAVTADLDGNRLVLDLNVTTDAVAREDLPLPPGAPTPRLPEAGNRIASAAANQSQTTVFLLRAVRAAYPKSAFVRDVARLERALHIDFEREVLRQFAGPSVSTVALDGSFAARSTVADPRAMRALLPKLAPHLPRLIEDLDGFGRLGRVVLLMFAPDAPVSTVAARHGVKVVRAHGLYRVGPLKGEGPSQLWFGLRGDTFVVASDAAGADAIARAPLHPAPAGVRGSAIAAADFERVPYGALAGRLGFEPEGLGTAAGWIDVTPSRLRASAHAELLRP